MLIPDTQELEKWVPIRHMISEYNKAVKEIQRGIELMVNARKRMAVFGTHHDGIFSGDLRSYDLQYPDRVKSNCLEEMKANGWKGIIDKSMVKNLMSGKKTEELEQQLEKPGELPELTFKNVQGFIEGLAGSMKNLLQEVMGEVFEILRPHKSQHKTNTEFEVGEKVILTWMFDTSYGMCHLHYRRESDIRAIDNVFHLLDGKGPIKYPGDALTKIRDTINGKLWECATDYFHLKWFKNGNLHIRFRRMDLVAELNKCAGGNQIKV